MVLVLQQVLPIGVISGPLASWSMVSAAEILVLVIFVVEILMMECFLHYKVAEAVLDGVGAGFPIKRKCRGACWIPTPDGYDDQVNIKTDKGDRLWNIMKHILKEMQESGVQFHYNPEGNICWSSI